MGMVGLGMVLDTNRQSRPDQTGAVEVVHTEGG